MIYHKIKKLINIRLKIICFFLCIVIVVFNNKIIEIILKKKLKVGVISVRHQINAGNFLIKYAMHIILSKLGFTPYIIATHYRNDNFTFINKTTNLVVIKNNFSEIKRDDYDILMVNSDQTWRKFDEHFYDYAFLKFAENWNITKFVYGASLGFDYWTLTPEDEKVAKRLLKKFRGISVREEGSVDLIQKHLNIIPETVLDPTLLINKHYYLDLIKGYSKETINSTENFILLYNIFNYPILTNFAYDAAKELGYKLYIIETDINLVIEDFIYSIVNSKAVLSNSFHGTVFSIIFNKPFITINPSFNAAERLKSLGRLFGVQNRIFNTSLNTSIPLLKIPPNVDKSLINRLRDKSIKFIKKNLELI